MSRTTCKALITAALLLAILPYSSQGTGADIKLPLLGDSTSGIISRQQEQELGQTWLKMFRSRVTPLDDPLMQQYLEDLVYNLATHSELIDPRIDLVIVNNPTMNAFAVPGGIIGFHTGIFNFADNEDQMASILAHELAHLSQRHFARGVEEQRKNSIFTMAGLLASIILAATTDGDAGTAAMISTQAAAMHSQLSFSRSNEQEADRQGLQTMQRAGRDPGAVADMFNNMLRATRYTGGRPPEFLLTHPVTEKRVSDARSRSATTGMRHYPLQPDFYLMRARAILALHKDPQRSRQYFSAEINGATDSLQGAQYGLALALTRLGEYQRARELIAQLKQQHPLQLLFEHADIEIMLANKEYSQALQRIDTLLRLNPHNYPLLVLKSELLWQSHRYQQAADLLKKLTRKRPTDPAIWYRLAEVSGLAGDISSVHLARAEYFILIGVFDKARQQLSLALALLKGDFKGTAMAEQRLRDLLILEERVENL